jgi:hypothetical protein
MARKDGQSPRSRNKRRPLPADKYLNQNKDPRPIWRREDAKAGLPLWEAMLFYGNQSDAEVVNDLTFQGFDKPPFFPLIEMTRAEQIELMLTRCNSATPECGWSLSSCRCSRVARCLPPANARRSEHTVAERFFLSETASVREN